MYSRNNNQSPKVIYNQAYVALIECDLQAISKRFNNPIIYDYDDLDYFEAIYFKLDDGFKFKLFKYKGMQDNNIAIFFQSQLMDWKYKLADIIKHLQIPEELVLDINESYLKVP